MDGIALDRNTLRALGADTRVKMLKLLGERRKMQAELAVELGLKPPSVREHLERLAEAGLVRRIESERKWKYYELTEKGSALVKPPLQTTVWFVLGLSAITALTSVYFAFQKLFITSTAITTARQASTAPLVQAMPEMAAAAVQEPGFSLIAGSQAAVAANDATYATQAIVQPALPLLELCIFAVALLAIGACAAMLWKRSRK